MASSRITRADRTITAGPTVGDAPMALIVTTPAGTFTHVLPRQGTVRIGRSRECEVAIEDHSISRVHALVHLDRVVSLEDAGSRNGTLLLGTPAQARERLPLPLGAAFQIGRATIVLVRKAAEPPVRLEASVVIASPPMRELFESLPRLSSTLLSVLILGETGVGKEVVARAIHAQSNRASGPFVAVNCAALPESIVESELFGHTRGAFTGAVAAKVGYFDAAHGGTLLLDEIGELSPQTQAKLLRVIETGEVMPLGSVRPKRVDVRFLAATNRDLRSLVQGGDFREDLYFRIRGAVVQVPPLRERREDVAPLAQSFARLAAGRLGRIAPELDPAAIAALEAHDWPGNVRELRSVVERAVSMAQDVRRLGLDQVQLGFDLRSPPASAAPSLAQAAPRVALTDATVSERDRIVAALAQAAGNQTLAAKLLGIPRRTLIRRIEEYEIGRPRKGAAGAT